jgi:hypothetical protein
MKFQVYKIGVVRDFYATIHVLGKYLEPTFF